MSREYPIRACRRQSGLTADRTQQSLRISSQELLDGGTKLVIDHGEESYILRLTRNGKLILTK